MKSPNSNLVFTAMLGACLFACNPQSETVDTSKGTGPVPETGSSFDQSALAIKASPTSQQEKIAALEALASRHGRTVAPQALPERAPILRETEKIEAGPLGKTAAVNRWYWMKVRGFGNNFAIWHSRKVLPNQSLAAWTTRPAGSTADPFLVAWHYAPGGTTSSDYIKVVGLNDDNPVTPSLDSRIFWKNTTGVEQWIVIIAFPYSPAHTGVVTVHSTVNSVNKQSETDFMDGFAVYDNNWVTTPIAGCTGPIAERLTLSIDPPGDYTYTAMMVNAETMAGAIIYRGGLQPAKTVNLPTPTPNGYPNFLLVFATSKDLGGDREAGAAAIQEQKFTCAN